jgi:hypothetical protein
MKTRYVHNERLAKAICDALQIDKNVTSISLRLQGNGVTTVDVSFNLDADDTERLTAAFDSVRENADNA